MIFGQEINISNGKKDIEKERSWSLLPEKSLSLLRQKLWSLLPISHTSTSNVSSDVLEYPGKADPANYRHLYPLATLRNMSVSGGAGGDEKSHPGSRDFFFLS